jgi:two-component system, OmpR family, alkaline phosphatase synthesis response regulator PhoP
MSYNILICDDEPHILLPVSLKLKNAGMNVVTARDGAEAWELFQRNPPDLLITDLTMPHLDGWELCRRVRQATEAQNIPIVLLTGRDMAPNSQRDAPSAYSTVVVHKPFSPTDLLRVVQTALESRAS